MILKLQSSTGYNLLSNNEYRNDSIYSPKSLNESDKLTESFPFLANTESTSTVSFETFPSQSNENANTLTKKNTLKRRKSEQIQMNDVFYQSLPELNVLSAENNSNDSLSTQISNLNIKTPLEETKPTKVSKNMTTPTSDETEAMVNIYFFRNKFQKS